MSSSPCIIEPYFDCGLDTSSTPAVVENFKLPNSSINKNGPFLQITEQPQTKFRFRYKSEMAGTHGQLKAESSDKNRAAFPTVKLCNWNGGPALIRLKLCTADENDNERTQHVHELSGKNCNKEGYHGGCEVVVDEKNEYAAKFPNLGIIHIAKRDVPTIIFQRKREKLVNDACFNYPELRNEGIQHNIPPTAIKKLKEEAEDEAKSMDLNKVVLRFQAFSYNTKASCYREITEHVDSDVIFNLKNASTGELKIVRISAVSAPCTGDTEIWIFVEKVKKNNVKIKFFELDQDGGEIWKGYGLFNESDVHHQYAIAFRTPPYHSSNINEPVQVKIQLERPTDNDCSESIDFKYTPKLKRSNDFLENGVKSELKSPKRVKHSPMEPVDLKRNHLFLGPRETNPISPESRYQQSPSPRVPSPVISVDSPLSQGFYSPPPHPTIRVSGSDEDFMQSPTQDDDNIFYPNNQVMITTEQVNSNTFQITLNADGSVSGFTTIPEGGYISPPCQQDQGGRIFSSQPHPVQSCSQYQRVPSISQSQPSPYDQGICSPIFPVPHNAASPVSTVPRQTNETPQDQIQQFTEFNDQYNSNISQTNNQFDFSDLRNARQNNQNEAMDLFDLIDNETFFSTSRGRSDIQADSTSTKEKSQRKNTSPEKHLPSSSTSDVDALTKQLASVSVSNTASPSKPAKDGISKHPANEQLLDRDNAFRMALKAAECLQAYAAYGDTSLLLDAHRYLLGVQNNQGDNSLHTAISNKSLEAFNKIIKAAIEVCCSDHLLNTQNFAGETPLHLAVKEQQDIMIERLLSSRGCKMTILDLDLNTPLHVAAGWANHFCLSILLNHPASRTPEVIPKIINIHNFHGKTPLHLAVSSGCLNKVKILLHAGADVHICERKQGANSLHLAVMSQHLSIAKYLINNTNMTVDAGMLDGNTALHIAAQAGNKEICAFLMKGMANPHARNSIRKLSKATDSEVDEEDEEEEHDDRAHSDTSDDTASGEDSEDEFYTPFDYAGDNGEILSILRGEVDLVTSEEQSVSVPIPASSSRDDLKNKMLSSSTVESGIDISSTDVTAGFY